VSLTGNKIFYYEFVQKVSYFCTKNRFKESTFLTDTLYVNVYACIRMLEYIKRFRKLINIQSVVLSVS